MTLSLSHSFPLLIGGALLAIAVTWWLYRRTTPELEAGKRLLLSFLRAAALIIILFLLMEPLLSDRKESILQPGLGILFDESQSMTLADSASYRELTHQIVQATSNERTSFFGFGGEGRKINSVDSLTTSAPRTNISSGLEYLSNSLRNEKLGAVLLVSDGRHLEGRSPEHLAENYPVPVITLVVGDTTAKRDLRIQQVISNNISYVGREVPVRVRIRNEGIEPATITVSLSLNDQQLDSQSVEIPPPGSEIVTELVFVPDTPGLFQYRINISRMADELTYRNNTELLPIQILDRERRVVIVAGAPSPDVAAIQRLLSANSETVVELRTQKSAGEYYEGSLEESVRPAIVSNAPDLIVLIGFPTSRTIPSDIETVSAAIEAGAALLFVMDRSTDLSRVQQSISKYLPATPRVIRSEYFEGSFVPTSKALQHVVFDISDRRETAEWKSLPPINLNQSTWDVTGGAVVLATTEIRGITLDDPVLVVNRVRNRRTAALLASGFWRWTNVPEDLSAASARWAELIANLTQWLVTQEDDRLVRVAPADGIIDESEPVVFGGQVYDENLAPVSDASISLTVRAPDGQLFPYQLQTLGNGQYTMNLGTLSGGTYSYEAIASRNGAEIGVDQGTFSVGSLAYEFRTPYADPALMRQIARRSGGFVIDASDLSSLPDRLAQLPTYAAETIFTESQTRLWRKLPFLLILLALLTAEWFFRKRFGLV